MLRRAKKVKWQKEWGDFVPVCPYCNEWAYEMDHCVFCDKPYKWYEPKGLPKPTVVEQDGYRVVQATNNHISVFKDDVLVLHSSCKVKRTKDELIEHLEMVKRIRERGRGD